MSPFAAPRRKPLLITLLLAGALAWGAPSAAHGAERRRIDGRNYTVHTDIKTDVAEQLVERLDNIYDEYARRLSGFGANGNGAPRPEAYLFEHQRDFMEFTGDPSPHVAGVFAPSVNRLALYLHDRVSLNRTLQHEAFHQFAHNTISPNMPIWLDEGLAVYFGEALWTGDHFLVGQVTPERLKRLREDIRTNRLIPFRELMAMSQAQWKQATARDPERAFTQYNQSWAMVHFLAHAGSGTTSYRPHMLQMLKLLHEGVPAPKAFADALSPNIEGFQDRFVEFVATMQPNEEAMMFERTRVLAHMLMLLRDRDMRFDSIGAMRETVTKSGYRITYGTGTETFQTDPDPSVYFQDQSGKLLPRERLYFAPRLHAPLPDIVCRWKDGLQYRARFFYGANRQIEHDIVPEGR
jgi:hypothetical protein